MEEVFRGRLNSEGRLNIPAPCRKRLGLQPGQEVLMQISDEGLFLYTQDQALKRLQNWVASAVPAGVSLADELIAERRAEAAKEASEQ
jgi:bifunctional DNA-binding transcriptional regulator/antitoxin component of YhaV-PrlF toxin-antitoxin module